METALFVKPTKIQKILCLASLLISQWEWFGLWKVFKKCSSNNLDFFESFYKVNYLFLNRVAGKGDLKT